MSQASKHKIIGLVALTGAAGCGKTALAQYLAKEYNYCPLAFADPIKEMLYTLPDLEDYRWTDRVWKESYQPLYDASPRKMAQTLGTEWGRNCIHADIWVNLLRVKMLRLSKQSPEISTFIVHDLRFENEAMFVRDFGGIIVHVTRTLPSDEQTIVREHISEAGIRMSNGDARIRNEGSLMDLYEDAEHLHEQAEQRFKLLGT